MTVFVLENGCYSDTHIVGVYSTRGLAEMAARIFKDDASITEYDIDDAAEEMRRGCVPFFVRLHRDTGDVLDCYASDTAYCITSNVGTDVHANLYTHCWAESRDVAIKIASDRRAMFLAGVTA